MKTVTILPGDGIGIDVMDACLPIIDRLGIRLNLKFGNIGWEYWKKYGDPVPKDTWNLVKKSDAVLLGAITSKPRRQALLELEESVNHAKEYISPVIQLRQKLNLFANVRPITDCSGLSRYDFCIIRENTEGLYSGLDFYPISEDIQNIILSSSEKFNKESLEKSAATIRVVTENGFERLLKFSVDWALKQGKKNIVIADKPNVFRQSSDLIFKLIRKYSKLYPDVKFSVENVDAVAMWMIKRPEKYEVIVCENQFGDILSDVGAAIMGGLGLAYSGNFGEGKLAYFEPVHGSAPKYAGLNKVNPMAMFFTISMLLDDLGFSKESQSIRKAISLAMKNEHYCTFDLGGIATLKESAEYIIEKAVRINGR